MTPADASQGGSAPEWILHHGASLAKSKKSGSHKPLCYLRLLLYLELHFYCHRCSLYSSQSTIRFSGALSRIALGPLSNTASTITQCLPITSGKTNLSMAHGTPSADKLLYDSFQEHNYNQCDQDYNRCAQGYKDLALSNATAFHSATVDDYGYVSPDSFVELDLHSPSEVPTTNTMVSSFYEYTQQTESSEVDRQCNSGRESFEQGDCSLELFTQASSDAGRIFIDARNEKEAFCSTRSCEASLGTSSTVAWQGSGRIACERFPEDLHGLSYGRGARKSQQDLVREIPCVLSPWQWTNLTGKIANQILRDATPFILDIIQRQREELERNANGTRDKEDHLGTEGIFGQKDAARDHKLWYSMVIALYANAWTRLPWQPWIFSRSTDYSRSLSFFLTWSR